MCYLAVFVESEQVWVYGCVVLATSLTNPANGNPGQDTSHNSVHQADRTVSLTR